MRTRLGTVVSLTAAMTLAIATVGAGAAAAPGEPDPDAPETSAPAEGADEAAGPATVGSGAGRTGPLQEPGAVEAPADRDTGPFQLTEPPPAPTTTTLPPPDQLPPNSGEGRRIVYSKTNQWVWLIEANGTIVKDHQVSGNRQWNLPRVGTYQVSSKSMYTCNIENPSLCWRYMVRFARGPNATTRDNIGFHEIPIDTRRGAPVQSEAQLGEPLSGGCIRQATPDAVFLWNWTPVGTTVVVLP